LASYQKRALIAIVVGNNAELRAQALFVANVFLMKDHDKIDSKLVADTCAGAGQ
jgi:hypothetical protein